MGSIYHAMDENLGVEVAVKENLYTTEEYARQFRLEAVILAKLRHPNLPRVTDHFVISGKGQYLVMDYIEGEDLRQRMEREGAISEEEAILVGAAMCDALAYLHTRNPSILHRDIKPSNIKITPDGHVFLVDFGLAKEVKGSQLTTTGARAMTPGYSPPEQYGTTRTDTRTDIYSLAATLYAALTGIIPEDGLARAMDSVELTPVRKRNPGVSPRLANVIEKAMDTKAENRFQTAEEFKQALLLSNVRTKILEGTYIVAPPPQARESEKVGEPAQKQDKMVKVSRAAVNSSRKSSGTGIWIFGTFFFMLFTLCLLCGIGSLVISDGLPGIIERILGVSETQAVSSPPTATASSTHRLNKIPTLTSTQETLMDIPSRTPTRRIIPPTATNTLEPTDPPPPPPTHTPIPTPTPTKTPIPTPTPTNTPLPPPGPGK